MSEKPVSATLLDESTEISLGELCRTCGTHAEWVIALVSEGILIPSGGDPREWRFAASSMKVVHTAKRLHADLGVNLAGVALALDLLSEVERLSARVERLSGLDPQLLTDTIERHD